MVKLQGFPAPLKVPFPFKTYSLQIGGNSIKSSIMLTTYQDKNPNFAVNGD